MASILVFAYQQTVLHGRMVQVRSPALGNMPSQAARATSTSIRTSQNGDQDYLNSLLEMLPRHKIQPMTGFHVRP